MKLLNKMTDITNTRLRENNRNEIKYNIKREYKLTNNTKLDMFLRLLKSKLKILDMLYVIDEKEKSLYELDELTIKKHSQTVRDFVVNGLDTNFKCKVKRLIC